jgi:hypothetical protein
MKGDVSAKECLRIVLWGNVDLTGRELMKEGRKKLHVLKLITLLSIKHSP